MFIKINVTAIGKWTASTNTLNGFSFSGTGIFTSTGDQTIALAASGTPAQAGVTTFTVKAENNQCDLIITVENSSSPNNLPPVANAGDDKKITLPTNTVTLTGSGTDSDGSIVLLSMVENNGPASFLIQSPTQASTAINSLVQGTYNFELKVTDNVGAIDKDTVRVTVEPAVVGGTGTLSFQQELYFVIGTLREMMVYDQSGKIIAINSDHRPDRKIFYSNNRISKIEYWYGGTSDYYRDEIHYFEYDANGNVIKISQLDTVTKLPGNPAFIYTYNSDNTLKSKISYHKGTSEVQSTFQFSYTNGNITSFTDDGQTYNVSYDNRTNTFSNIYPQFYFLDLQNVFEETDRSEIFFFSKNYPTQISTLPISVTTTSGSKPFEVRFDNEIWYRYGYN